jgi:hypothetical protein
MSGSTLDELHKGWLERPGYKAAYDALEEEFAIASALIEARPRAVEDNESCLFRTHEPK